MLQAIIGPEFGSSSLWVGDYPSIVYRNPDQDSPGTDIVIVRLPFPIFEESYNVDLQANIEGRWVSVSRSLRRYSRTHRVHVAEFRDVPRDKAVRFVAACYTD